MADELQFRLFLFVLSLTTYVCRTYYVWGVSQGRKKERPGFGCIAVMMLWSLSLLTYSFGAGWTNYHLPIPLFLRWFGLVLMVIAFLLSFWDDVHEFFSSRIALGGPMFREVLGLQRLRLNPVFLTFCACVLGAVLLSANAIVLGTSICALIAMGLWVKRDYATA